MTYSTDIDLLAEVLALWAMENTSISFANWLTVDIYYI